MGLPNRQWGFQLRYMIPFTSKISVLTHIRSRILHLPPRLLQQHLQPPPPLPPAMQAAQIPICMDPSNLPTCIALLPTSTPPTHMEHLNEPD